MRAYEISSEISDVTMAIYQPGKTYHIICPVLRYEYVSDFDKTKGERVTKFRLLVKINTNNLGNLEITDVFTEGEVDICLQYPQLYDISAYRYGENTCALYARMNEIWRGFLWKKLMERELSTGIFLLRLEGKATSIEYEYDAIELIAK